MNKAFSLKKQVFFVVMKQQSPNFYNNAFQNLEETPQLAKGYSMAGIMKDFFSRPKSITPSKALPNIKTDLKSYHSKKPSIIWFGHSSYLIHCDGINILVDPVLSGYASPFSFYIKAFNGADIYKAEDMPAIDVMLITHNHYDHLDTKAIRALSNQTSQFVMPLGVSDDVSKLITNNQPITELDWWQTINIKDYMQLTATPARHFSGRGIKRNQSLWSSFVLAINGYKIFIGSDSGNGHHFKTIGDQYGPFDIALLECGQYNTAWPYIHSMPEELIAETVNLKAAVTMPVHWAKFALAMHDWDEPIQRFVTAADSAAIDYTTPMIGEPVIISESYPKSNWWE